MTYSLVGTPWTQSGNNQNTVAVAPTAIGDLMVLCFDDNDSRVSSSACSGGGVTTWNLAKSVVGANYAAPVEIWWGVVTSTGSSTITLTNSGVDSGDFTRFWVGQWHSSTGGTWSANPVGNLAGTGTSFSYPLLAGSGLYFGAAGEDFGNIAAGSTSGFTYAIVDGHLMVAYDTAASSSQPNGAATDSGANITAIGALFNVSASVIPVPLRQPEYPQRTIIPMYSTPRRRQTADVPLITKNAFIYEPPRYPQNFTKAGLVRRIRQSAAATGWPVPVQPPAIPATGEHRYSKPPFPRKGVVSPTGLPVPVQPPEASKLIHQRFTRVLLFRRGNVAPTGWPVPSQPPNIPDALRFIGPRRHFLRPGVVAPTNLPEPRQIPYSERQRQPRLRFLRYSGVVPPTGLPVPVQPPERMQAVHRWSRPLWPRRGTVRSVTPPPVSFNPPTSWSERRWSRPPWPRRGLVPPTGWPVPVQPPERMQSVRRFSRPLFPRRGNTINTAPPPVVVNPPISYSERRWSRPPWPRKSVVASTGWPVPVQPPELPHSLRRWTRALLPRRGVVAPSVTPPPVLLIPFAQVAERHTPKPVVRYARTVQVPETIPGPITSVERPVRFRKFSGPRRVAPGVLQPPYQAPYLPAAIRRENKLRRFRRGNAQPNTGLPVPVQPLERMQFVRRWIKPLFPRRGAVPPSAPPPVVTVEVKLPVWCWITIGLPDVTISNPLPFTWITISIPLVNEEEV